MSQLGKNVLSHLKTVGGEPFITGGSVRDKLLEIPVRDTDVVVFGMNESLLRRELERFGQVLTYGKSFRVYQVRGLAIEFSLPRNGIPYNGKNYKEFPLMQRLKRDAEGRDFTVNALYMDPLTEEIEDPLGGLKDLKMKRLRMTSRHTFDDDPLRVLRAVQLSTRMGFSVEESTMEAIRHVSLQTVAKERIYEELNKWLLGSDPARGWKIMEDTGHIPEICDIEKGFRQVMCDVLTCAVSYRSQSAKPVQWMWGVVLSVCLLSKNQYHQKTDQKKTDQRETLNRLISQFEALSSHHDHSRIVSESLWGVKNVQCYSVRKPDVVRLSLGVNLDELMLTMRALKPFWEKTGMHREMQQAMNRIIKMKPQKKIRPLVKGIDLKKWGFTEGKTMGVLLEAAFQMQLEGVTKKQIEAYFKKFQGELQNIGQ